MLVHSKPGDSRLPQRGAFAPPPTSQFYQHRYVAAFSSAPQLQPLYFRSVIRLCQKPAASRTEDHSMIYQCFVGEFLIFCRPAQKSCPPVFPLPPVLRSKFQMAEKYTEPRWRAGARFSATPGDGGWAPRMGISRAQPARPRRCLIGPCPPAGGELPLPYVHERRTFAGILRIVIENPTNHPISKQSVITLVRIICIERTWSKYAPLCPM